MFRNTFLFLLAFLVTTPPLYAATITPLLETKTSWQGAPLENPDSKMQMTAVKITLKPSELMPFHCHPLLTFGYVESGDLRVETLDGKSHEFHKGDAIAEVVKHWHRGRNLSDTKPVELVVFYYGDAALPTTILYKNQKECAVETAPHSK